MTDIQKNWLLEQGCTLLYRSSVTEKIVAKLWNHKAQRNSYYKYKVFYYKAKKEQSTTLLQLRIN
jgi:hypothetical protein